ncbi:hypothetical protein [Nocardia gipuzkoensis]
MSRRASDVPEHECRQGKRCKARTRDADDRLHGAGVERGGSLCRPCEEHVFADIRQLSDDYLLLTVARTMARSKVTGPKVSGSSERPIPISLAADTLMTTIDNEATRWAVRITRGEPLSPHPIGQVLECLRILCSNLGTLVDMPRQVVGAYFPYPDGGDWDGRLELDGVDAVLRLASLHQRAMRVLGLEPEKDERLNDEYCHVCGIAALTISVRTDLITCRNPDCRNVWHREEFARLNNPLAAA